MRRPWQIWIGFGCGLALLLGAMGWVSSKLLEMEQNEIQAEQNSELEENARLALWRIDSELAPIIARESVRNYGTYRSFYSADRPFTCEPEDYGQNQVLVPSPLLNGDANFVQLHFQISPDGAISSPQVPEGQLLSLGLGTFQDGDDHQKYKTLLGQIQADNESRALAALQPFNRLPEQLAGAYGQQKIVVKGQEIEVFDYSGNKLNGTAGQELASGGKGQTKGTYDNNSRDVQQMRNDQEYEKRKANVTKQQQTIWEGNNFSNGGNPVVINPEEQTAQGPAQQAAEQSSMSQDQQRQSTYPPNDTHSAEQEDGEPSQIEDSEVEIAGMNPYWIENRLFLARHVTEPSGIWVQGCWLDWPELKRKLENDIYDLLPNATLERIPPGASVDPARAVASLPLHLIPGSGGYGHSSEWSTLRMSLIIAWCCVLFGIGAAFFLFRGAVTLSERRGAFVSAVTHELRTPLTTFRMYTEMLSEGMISEEKEQEYLNTLRDESNRLGHLVENVLAYSRLERNPAASRVEALAAGALLDRVVAPAQRHADREKRELTIEMPESLRDVSVSVDAPAAEQIFFNLIDNACKYSASAEDARIHVSVSPTNGHLEFRVRDHGPGITSDDRGRIFQPFRKSARDAAGTAPGVGLGLALSRRLARAMGGDLRLDASISDGACFVLVLKKA